MNLDTTLYPYIAPAILIYWDCVTAHLIYQTALILKKNVLILNCQQIYGIEIKYQIQHKMSLKFVFLSIEFWTKKSKQRVDFIIRFYK